MASMLRIHHTIDDFSLADFRVSYQFNSPSPEKERPLVNMSMPSFGEPHGVPLGKSEKVSPNGRFSHIDDEKFFSKGATNSTVSASWYDAAKIQRPHVGGKFLFVGRDKLWIRGVTYGAFRPGPNGQEYHETKVLERDFSLMAANGLNAVRIPHTTPPRNLLNIAQRHGLRVMVGLSAEQYAGYLI